VETHCSTAKEKFFTSNTVCPLSYFNFIAKVFQEKSEKLKSLLGEFFFFKAYSLCLLPALKTVDKIKNPVAYSLFLKERYGGLEEKLPLPIASPKFSSEWWALAEDVKEVVLLTLPR
jgi:hypothetical protein